MARWAVEHRHATIKVACLAFSISETCYRYQAKLNIENDVIADWLIRLTTSQRNWGFGLCFLHIRNVKGFRWNHKRVYRIYRVLELNFRIKPRKRLVRERPQPLSVPSEINQVWSMDFMHDQIIEWRGQPQMIRCDNGPEYVSNVTQAWAEKRGIQIEFIRPGQPQQNAYIERYNRTVRYDWLAHHLFDSLEEIQDFATKWLWTYNHDRPNTGIGGITPKQKLALAA